MDAEDNVILSYQQYTGDWEAVGFTFTGTYEDGDVVSFERNITATYAWVRVDVQPDLTSYIDSQISIVQADISNIEALIPAQASTSNQLADKNFVNSSISTNTANFVGTFNSVAELEAYSGTVTNNDYAFVIGTDSAGNTTYNRYKYNGDTQQWIYEYTLNNSSFTAAQWAAIQSGITAAKVSTYDGYAATIANKQDAIPDLSTIRAGAAAGATAVQPGDLATVATSGSYNDLSDKPTIGDGTITVIQGGVTRGTISVNQTNNTTIALEAGGSGVPPGIIVPFAGSVIPAGFLLCDGSAVSRTDYADLFNAIGTTYGDGDGSTTFNLPNKPEFYEQGRYAATTNLSNTTYTATDDGIVLWAANNTQRGTLTINGVQMATALGATNAWADCNSIAVPVRKGDAYKSSGRTWFYFFPKYKMGCYIIKY
ncbi:MAG: tail fiber protein [Alphaproteobacteria bacterium]|nr:tail fiber protein [Alphaproteobacteria bacterium]